MRKVLVGAAAAAMVMGSTVAQAAPVSAPIADARTATAVEGESLGGSTVWLGLLAAALLGLVLWQINDNDADDNFPVSP